MITFLVTFLGVFVLYFLLVAGSGTGEGFFGQLVSVEELVAGLVLALIAAIVARMLLGRGENEIIRKPVNLLIKPFVFLVYLVPFLLALTKANLDVAFRVITGRINPGIVRIRPGLKTNLGRTVLANSITLTPGTLTVDVDEGSGDLLVHWINVKETEDEKERMKKVCGSFPAWARRVAE